MADNQVELSRLEQQIRLEEERDALEKAHERAIGELQKLRQRVDELRIVLNVRSRTRWRVLAFSMRSDARSRSRVSHGTSE